MKRRGDLGRKNTVGGQPEEPSQGGRSGQSELKLSAFYAGERKPYSLNTRASATDGCVSMTLSSLVFIRFAFLPQETPSRANRFITGTSDSFSRKRQRFTSKETLSRNPCLAVPTVIGQSSLNVFKPPCCVNCLKPNCKFSIHSDLAFSPWRLYESSLPKVGDKLSVQSTDCADVIWGHDR